MCEEVITIDVERLRYDMRDDSLAAFYIGGFGGALVDSFDIDRASNEELIAMAQKRGIDLRKYKV